MSRTYNTQPPAVPFTIYTPDEIFGFPYNSVGEIFHNMPLAPVDQWSRQIGCLNPQAFKNFCLRNVTTESELFKQLFEMYLAIGMRFWDRDALRLQDSTDELLDYLEQTDFFDAPASTKYHENFKGGLCLHSLKVMNRALMLLDSNIWDKSYEFLGKVIICALIHDICKVGLYEKQGNIYKWRTDRDTYLGHGEYSAIQALKFIPFLDDDMLMAIRWHMGLWDCSNSGQGDYSNACQKVPLVHLIQFADLLSITDY